MKAILAAVDFSDVTLQVVAMARQLAGALGSRVILLHVVPPEPAFVGYQPGPESVRLAVAHDVQHEHAALARLKESLVGLDVCALQIQGPIADRIVHEAATQEAGMIVIGPHGHGALYHLLAGSVTTEVLRHAKCPVLVVPAARQEVG